MAPVPDEFALQRAHCIWLFGNPDPKTGIPRTRPALRPDVECWHTPNGGTRTSGFEGMRLNQIGLKAGVHDLLYLRPTDFGALGTWGLLFGQEWKRPDAKRLPLEKRSAAHRESRSQLIAAGNVPERLADTLSDSQLEMHPRMLRAGLAASIVVDNLHDAREWCHEMALTFRF